MIFEKIIKFFLYNVKNYLNLYKVKIYQFSIFKFIQSQVSLKKIKIIL